MLNGIQVHSIPIGRTQIGTVSHRFTQTHLDSASLIRTNPCLFRSPQYHSDSPSPNHIHSVALSLAQVLAAPLIFVLFAQSSSNLNHSDSDSLNLTQLCSVHFQLTYPGGKREDRLDPKGKREEGRSDAFELQFHLTTTRTHQQNSTISRLVQRLKKGKLSSRDQVGC